VRSVILDVLDVDWVLWNRTELTERPNQGQVVSNRNRAYIEEQVVVRAQTQ